MNVSRKLRAGVAVTALVAGVGVPVAQAVSTPQTCVAHVSIFEDSSWGGNAIFAADGTQIAPAWDIQGPEAQGTVTGVAYGFYGENIVQTYHSGFPVSVAGQECTIVAD